MIRIFRSRTRKPLDVIKAMTGYLEDDLDAALRRLVPPPAALPGRLPAEAVPAEASPECAKHAHVSCETTDCGCPCHELARAFGDGAS